MEGKECAESNEEECNGKKEGKKRDCVKRKQLQGTEQKI